jgi:hypothetical protein
LGQTFVCKEVLQGLPLNGVAGEAAGRLWLTGYRSDRESSTTAPGKVHGPENMSEVLLNPCIMDLRAHTLGFMRDRQTASHELGHGSLSRASSFARDARHYPILVTSRLLDLTCRAYLI